MDKQEGASSAVPMRPNPRFLRAQDQWVDVSIAEL
jgi:hypothetical protein